MTYGAGGVHPPAHARGRHLGPPRDGHHADGPPHLPGAHAGRDRPDPRRLPGRGHREHPGARRRRPRRRGRRPGPSDYAYASDLLDDVVAEGCFSIGVAAHPEVHPRSLDRDSDRRTSWPSSSGADFAITQFFFEADVYLRLVDELDALGCSKPVVPGIMPVTNLAQVQRMAELSGAAFPTWLADDLASAGDPHGMRKVGVEAATEAVQRPARRRCTRPALLHAEPFHRDPRHLHEPGSARLTTEASAGARRRQAPPAKAATSASHSKSHDARHSGSTLGESVSAMPLARNHSSVAA